MAEISDIQKYNTGMKKSIEDKLFFMDRLKGPIALIDYGCANGELIKEVKRREPKSICFGYDNNKQMLAMAKENAKEAGVFFTHHDCFDLMKDITDSATDCTQVFNLSSVLHEVYSYGTNIEIEKFWNDVAETGFDYITIRDMAFIDRHILDPKTVFEKFLEGIEKLDKCDMFYEFLHTQPDSPEFDKMKAMVHFMLKYRYIENWSRECFEDYFSVSVEDICEKLEDNYDLIYLEHYTLPFLKEKIKEDFDIDLEFGTSL